MDEALSWFEGVMALRHAAQKAKMSDPDFAAYHSHMEAYEVTLHSIDESHIKDQDHFMEDLDWYEDELEILAPKRVLSAAHYGDDRYSFVTSHDNDPCFFFKSDLTSD